MHGTCIKNGTVVLYNNFNAFGPIPISNYTTRVTLRRYKQADHTMHMAELRKEPSRSPNAALLAQLKYEVSRIDSHPTDFLYQFRFCIVLWPCNQVMSWHSTPSSTSVPSHPTAFRTIESDDRQTRTASSLCSSVRTSQIGSLEFTTNINAFRDM